MIACYSSITSAKRWVGGGGQMLMFADKVGGLGWSNAVVSKKIQEKNFCFHAQKKKVDMNIGLIY